MHTSLLTLSLSLFLRCSLYTSIPRKLHLIKSPQCLPPSSSSTKSFLSIDPPPSLASPPPPTAANKDCCSLDRAARREWISMLLRPDRTQLSDTPHTQKCGGEASFGFWGEGERRGFLVRDLSNALSKFEDLKFSPHCSSGCT